MSAVEAVGLEGREAAEVAVADAAVEGAKRFGVRKPLHRSIWSCVAIEIVEIMSFLEVSYHKMSKTVVF